MEYVLIVVTLVSLALALAMGALVVKMMRDDRLRSDARVETLMGMAGVAPDLEAAPERQQSLHSTVGIARSSHAAPPDAQPHPEAAFAEPDLELQASPPAGVGALFVEAEPSSPWLRRIGVAAVIAAALVIVGFTVTAWPRGSAATDGPMAAQGAGVASLELLSLGHTQKAEGLTITGLVQNPRGAAPVARVTATAFLFAADGSFLGSGRAPLDFSLLQPGDESPFVITVPVSGTVARYRIGFRDNDGRVIGHVDRRDASAVARQD